ncbi:hypothetical protein BN873_p10001 [Candidatus Competibacter denitrificans Run_A_D11]|uniref:Uncharacterized protein n=1 Tax=Candidatus Competibacter denitrificans Run_A_D11 TaxID=1400863 RepID=W6MA42_9GAMM|nr:hypothetical protein BN873_p10001 [Candidatus Competibacter denitrificans Run_A_D11]
MPEVATAAVKSRNDCWK